MINPTPPVSCKYGAPMGRRSYHGEPDGKFFLRRVRLDNGGYDSGGAYWGLGQPLYFAQSGDVSMFFRASSRDQAKLLIRDSYPEAKFWR